MECKLSTAISIPSQDDTCRGVFDSMRKMRLIHNGEDIVRSLHGVGDEARILDDKDLVL